MSTFFRSLLSTFLAWLTAGEIGSKGIAFFVLREMTSQEGDFYRVLQFLDQVLLKSRIAESDNWFIIDFFIKDVSDVLTCWLNVVVVVEWVCCCLLFIESGLSDCLIEWLVFTY